MDKEQRLGRAWRSGGGWGDPGLQGPSGLLNGFPKPGYIGSLHPPGCQDQDGEVGEGPDAAHSRWYSILIDGWAHGTVGGLNWAISCPARTVLSPKGPPRGHLCCALSQT